MKNDTIPDSVLSTLPIGLGLSMREEVMGPHFTKYHLEGLPFPAVLHRFLGPDIGDPHDHPWSFRTHVLAGGYTEEIWDQGRDLMWTPFIYDRVVGHAGLVPAHRIHRIVALPQGECWTLILPIPCPRPRKSGFFRFEGDTLLRRAHDEDEFRVV